MRSILAALACVDLVFLVGLAGCGTTESGPHESSQGIEALRSQVLGLVEQTSGEVGVSIRHLESGLGFDIDGDRRFPTASMYKVPIMIEVFRQREEGVLSLDERISIQPDVLHFSTVLSRFDPGLNPTLRDLVFLMITESENAATDIVLNRVGADRVTATMQEFGFPSVSVDRTVKEMMEDYLGLSPEQRILTGPAFAAMMDSSPERAHYSRMWREADAAIPESVHRFSQEPKDVASPNDLTRILEMIARGQMVSAEASAEMLDIMLEARFGSDLLAGELPPQTPVARKSGTLPTSLGETGIIFLPEGRGRLVVTVMTNRLRETRETSGGLVSRISRLAYEFFVSEGDGASVAVTER
ncbi:MAG: serine hydrolase [Dehalococcoidia bacterium]